MSLWFWLTLLSTMYTTSWGWADNHQGPLCWQPPHLMRQWLLGGLLCKLRLWILLSRCFTLLTSTIILLCPQSSTQDWHQELWVYHLINSIIVREKQANRDELEVQEEKQIILYVQLCHEARICFHYVEAVLGLAGVLLFLDLLLVLLEFPTPAASAMGTHPFQSAASYRSISQ